MTGVADMTSEGEEGISKCKIGCKVTDWTEVWYPSGMQEHRTGCNQEHSTWLVHRDIAQVVDRSMVPGWYTGVLHK